MSDEFRQARYLQALSRIHPSQAHELRTRLGVVTLQLGLLEEWVQRLDPSAAEVRAQLGTHLQKAVAGMRELHAALERTLNQTRLDGAEGAQFELRALLRDLEARLAPFGRELGVELALALPEHPVLATGGRDAPQQELLALLVERLASAPRGGRLALRLDTSGGTARLTLGEDAGAPEMLIPLAPEST